MEDTTDNSSIYNDTLYIDISKETDLLIKKGFPKNNLYHYTNFAGLKGIIESKQLWLTDYRHLNDTSEVKYSLDKISEIIKTHVNNKKYNVRFWEYFIKSYNAMLASDDFSLFVCSFCKKSDYLPAWRGYADDARGFAIGLNKNVFESKYESDINKPQHLSSKIYYGNKLNTIYYLIEKIIDLTENRLENENINSDILKYYNYICTIVASELLVFLPFIKHAAYKEEHEYRIIEQDFMNPNPRKFYRATDTKRPYTNSIPTTPKNINADNICEIWIGPRNNFEYAKQEIEKMLENNHYNAKTVNIRKSKIPYRNN